MDPVLLSSACALFNTSPEELTPLYGGFSNAVYEFRYGDRPAVLRLGVEDCPPDQTLAMLEWVSFLRKEGAPVIAPLASIKNRLLENLRLYGKSYTLTVFEKAEGTLAERIPPGEWTDELFTSIGRAAGKLHAVSKRYRPSRPGRIRPQWFDGFEVRDATRRLASSPGLTGEKLAALINDLKKLPAEPADYGLIHDDLHFANFLIQPGGKVSIIDFDDCAYGWFAMDVAMALFDVLVLYHANTEEESQDFARHFLHHYLSGYRTENELSPYWQEQIPHFLKLKELCIYASLINHQETELGGWGGLFMPGRAERIAHDLPYVDINFSNV